MINTKNMIMISYLGNLTQCTTRGVLNELRHWDCLGTPEADWNADFCLPETVLKVPPRTKARRGICTNNKRVKFKRISGLRRSFYTKKLVILKLFTSFSFTVTHLFFTHNNNKLYHV